MGSNPVAPTILFGDLTKRGQVSFVLCYAYIVGEMPVYSLFELRFASDELLVNIVLFMPSEHSEFFSELPKFFSEFVSDHRAVVTWPSGGGRVAIGRWSRDHRAVVAENLGQKLGKMQAAVGFLHCTIIH